MRVFLGQWHRNTLKRQVSITIGHKGQDIMHHSEARVQRDPGGEPAVMKQIRGRCPVKTI